MRHSPTAYKFEKPSLRGFYNPRVYGSKSLIETSIKVQSVNAFGLKLVERSCFMADKRIPIEIKRNLRAQAGAWVLYLPKHERTTIFIGDDPARLCALAAAHMSQLSKGA